MSRLAVKKVAALGDREKKTIFEENRHYITTGEWNRTTEPSAAAMLARIARLEQENRDLKELLEVY